MKRRRLASILLLVCVVSLPRIAFAKRFPQGLPEETQTQVIELHKLLGRDLADPDDETPLRLPPDEESRGKAMDLLLKCIEDKSPIVRRYSLCTAAILTNTGSVRLDEVATLLAKILEHRKDENDDVRRTVTSILWDVKVAGMPEKPKLAYLRDCLVGWRDANAGRDPNSYEGVPHHDTILHFLAEMATPESVEIIKEAEARKAAPALSVQSALLKAELVRATDKLAAARKIMALRGKDAPENACVFGAQTWAIRKLEDAKGVDEKALLAFLKEAFDSKELDIGVCRHAGLALRRRGVKVDMSAPRFPVP